jgi:hypothetical protein
MNFRGWSKFKLGLEAVIYSETLQNRLYGEKIVMQMQAIPKELKYNND